MCSCFLLFFASFKFYVVVHVSRPLDKEDIYCHKKSQAIFCHSNLVTWSGTLKTGFAMTDSNFLLIFAFYTLLRIKELIFSPIRQAYPFV